MTNQSILKILLNINCKSEISIMLIIPKDILFKLVIKSFFDHEIGGAPALIDLIGLYNYLY